MENALRADYLVVGSGIAGLYFALGAANHGQVLIVTKKTLWSSSTNWAQGGIAAVLSSNDRPENHVADTLRVGDGLCKQDIVELTVNEGPRHVRALAELGVEFAREPNGAFKLTREGGHSARRVAYYKDMTGNAIQSALVKAVTNHPKIRVLANHIAVDLLSTAKHGQAPGCYGAFVLNTQTGKVQTVVTRATVLATGGASKIYIYTSNPDIATGDGIAMAYRIGANITNLEFVQFHPTVLYHPHAGSFLISEALRGEGGILRHADGRLFMADYHPDQELAPRDVVARAIDNELKKTGHDCVFLDMTHLNSEFVRTRFPTIAARCAALGIDITKQPVPVVPAAHYMCGGIETDSFGRTAVPNLFAIGECAHTGLHGACRLASNSLLEGVVFSARAARTVKNCAPLEPSKLIPWTSDQATDSNDAIVVALNWDEIRRFMWSYMGIVRSNKRIARARRRIELLRQEIREYYVDFKIDSDIVELRNLALVAHLIADSARARRESRGLHYTLDYPHKKSAQALDTVLNKRGGPPPA